jgi:sarcosine/dimethylglycine N-methyltransferase
MSTLKSSPLYHLAHVLHRLEVRFPASGPLTVPELVELDQLHYLGTDALDEAADKLTLSPEKHVLDIGSGLGGPARYLAYRYGCRVTGVELQQDFFQTGVELTRRANIDHLVDFIHADFTRLDLQGQQFDHWISFLAFLHIPDRKCLFDACARALRPGQTFYIEDFFQRRPLAPGELRDLSETVACPYLPTESQYLADLRGAGFTDIEWSDATPIWQPWVADRSERFRKDHDQHVKLHGPALTENLDHFYQVIRDLFSGGNLGGVKIHGRLARS